MTVYTTCEAHNREENRYYWNEYRLKDNVVTMYCCCADKCSGGEKHYNNRQEDMVRSWDLDDPALQDWIREHLLDERVICQNLS